MTYTEYQAQATSLANSMASILCFDDIVSAQQQLMSLQIALFDYLATAGDVNPEVIAARSTYATLSDRLNAISSAVQLGTCTASANFALKAVTLPGFVLYTGARIAVKFTNGCNTVNGLGINANNTGTKGIQLRGANLISTDQAWNAGDTVAFVYDGSYWQMEDNSALSKLVARVPIGALVPTDISFFKPSANQAVTAGQTPTIALAKLIGGLTIDGSYFITLTKGYFYEIDFGLAQFVSSGAGALAIARIVKSDGTTTGYGVDAGAIGVTNATGRMDTPNATHIIDLTGAGADISIKYMLAYTDVNCTVNKDSTYVKIKQYKKAV